MIENFFNFMSNITLIDVQIYSLIITLIIAISGFYKWIKNLSMIRANYINELAEKIRTDKDIEDTIYRIEYGEEWYNKDFYGSKDVERKDTERAVDKTLLFFSHAVYLSEEEIIDKKSSVFWIQYKTNAFKFTNGRLFL